MKITRLLAASTGIAIAGALVATALPATAAQPVGDAYKHKADIGAETSPYPTSWFAGSLGSGKTTDSVADTASGLTVVGDYQLMNGANTGDGAAIAALVSNARVVVPQGAAAFQISLFAHPDAATAQEKGFTTLRPTSFADPTTASLPAPDAAGGWTTSQNIDATHVKDGAYSLNELLEAIGPDAQILATGVFLNRSTGPNSVAAITWNGLTTRFTPAGTATVDKPSVSQSEFAATGVTFTFSGFVPGESVWLTSDGERSPDDYLADEDGIVIVTLGGTGASDGLVAPDTYSIDAEGMRSGVVEVVSFTITADESTTPETPAYTPTGDEKLVLKTSGTLTAGSKLTVDGSGFRPGTVVSFELHSDPIALGSAVADQNGVLSFVTTVPTSAPAGSHTLVALVNGQQIATAAVQIAATARPAALAETGVEANTGLLAAGALVLAGLTMVLVRRRANAIDAA
ncbi:LPXTG cell wall anchor domain-containing protein [Schumannella sp. 10F1B-5-1]|uniref:LPXTG cell wall anchor domain-containing protein n=1 Tax=Schumannella sp. 10F1B-5-1 TaxID=2590780 RepID=UPI001130BCAB|nr:LPXTG cell wall anchor domain-containing protein [Schumannella sp. 10F1B-5-1]TPW70216.1 LPXTG cell wall anchor domain-containing protein [Schumannella sp. 10F1B-5-1]